VFGPIVYRWARQAGLSGADSADVVQDVFIAVARNIPNFQRQKTTASFRSWLATITRNRVRDCFRKQQLAPGGFGGTEALRQFQNVVDPNQADFLHESRQLLDVGDDAAPDSVSADPVSVDDSLEQSISLASLDRRLPARVLEIVKAECDPRTWEAFWLTTVKGDAAADVAERLEMNVASVYQAKSRILRRLRKRMEELP
jgi:RNA polymerase sigma-70 factor (ECF subfamily)